MPIACVKVVGKQNNDVPYSPPLFFSKYFTRGFHFNKGTFFTYSNGKDTLMKRILFLIITILAITMPASALAKSIGLFTAVSGTVEVRSEDVSRQVEAGAIVNVSDVVYTFDNARAEITFHDGNIIRLASNTSLQVTEYEMRGLESSQVISLLMGKLRNIVNVIYGADSTGKKGKYEIHTGIAICGVRGTDFFVYHEDEVSGAIFLKGIGYAYSRDVPGEVVTVTVGQQMTVRSATEAPRVALARPQDIERFKKATQTLVQMGKEGKEIKGSPQKMTSKVSKQKQAGLLFSGPWSVQ